MYLIVIWYTIKVTKGILKEFFLNSHYHTKERSVTGILKYEIGNYRRKRKRNISHTEEEMKEKKIKQELCSAFIEFPFQFVE